MILQLYDLNHTRIAGLKNFKDAVVESELSTGDKTLSFLWHQNNHQKIPQEYYVRTDKDEFVVKENSKASKGYRKIVAKLNVEEIEGRTWSEFIIEGCTAQEAADYALTDTGWSCISTVPAERLRKISMKKVNSFQILEKILEAFTCEVKFDTLSKVVYLMEQVGEDKGAYFIDGLNLREITDSGDSYDYATIIIPIGADGLEITEINGGNNYLENYQYSNKKKTVIWEDSSYTDAEALMEDAAYRLNEISKPKVTYRAKTVDLAKINSKYNALAYSVGDTATFISNKDGIREKQRITKTVEYIDNPQKNTCDISNTVLSFEEMQKKLFAAAECIGNITTDNGTVRGSSVDKIDITQIIGFEHYIAEDVDDMKVNYLYVKNELGTPYAVIGEGVFTNIGTTNLNVNNRADIGTAYINELHVEEFTGDRASFKTVEADNIAALEARLNKITSTEITVEYLEANYAQVNFANVEKEYVKNLFVDIGLITDATIVDGHITGNLDSVNINANCITAGTLAVDRLMIRGSEDSLIYELNNITGALQAANVNTLNGEILTPRTINCDRLVAGSITANEIASGTITGDKLVAGSITAREIASATITGDKIAANAITANHIATHSITADKLDVTDLAALGATISGFEIRENYIKSTSDLIYEELTKIGIEFYKTKKMEFYGMISDGKYDNLNYSSKYIWIDADVETYDENGNVTGKTKEYPFYVLFNGTTHADELSAGNLTVSTIKTNEGILNVPVNASIEDVYIPKTGWWLSQALHNDYADSVNCHKGIKWNACADGNYFTFRPYLPTNQLQITKNDSEGLLNIFTDGRVKTKGKISAPEVYVSYDDATEARVSIVNSVHHGCLSASAAGNLGIYDVTYGKWIVRSDSSGAVTLNGTANVSNYAAEAYKLTYNGYTFTNADSSAINVGLSDSASKSTGISLTRLRGSNVRVYAHSGGGVYLGNSGSTAITSDERLKDLYSIDERYDRFFEMLNPSTYIYKNNGHRKHIGFGARAVERALLNAGISTEEFAGVLIDRDVTICADEAGTLTDVHYDEMYSLRYEEFIALNTYMIQKLMKRVAELETYINMSKAIA